MVKVKETFATNRNFLGLTLARLPRFFSEVFPARQREALGVSANLCNPHEVTLLSANTAPFMSHLQTTTWEVSHCPAFHNKRGVLHCNDPQTNHIIR